MFSSGEMSPILIFLCVIILLIIFCFIIKISVSLYVDKRKQKYYKFVIENSIPIKLLKEVNDRYNFIKLTNFDEEKIYDNEKFYEQISCEDYLIYQLQYKKYDIKKQIDYEYSNNAKYAQYIQDVGKIKEFGKFDNYSNLNLEKLKKLEKNLFNEKIIKKPKEFTIQITLKLATINNHVYRCNSKTFDSYHIKELIDRVNDKNRDFYNDKEIWDSICRVERGRVSNKLRFYIYERDGYRCRNCGATEEQDNLEIDHIKPISKGGKSTEDNLQTLCKRCNQKKGSDYY